MLLQLRGGAWPADTAAGSGAAVRAAVACSGVHVGMTMYRGGHLGALDAQQQRLAPATIRLRSLHRKSRSVTHKLHDVCCSLK